MSRVVSPLLVWPVALAGTAAMIVLSASGLLSLVAAHASAPSPVHVRLPMPAPRLIARANPPLSAPKPATVSGTPSVTVIEPSPPTVALTPIARVGAAGATLRGAAGDGALAVWQLRPGTPVVVLASRSGWSQVDQSGLVGWVPSDRLAAD